MKVCIKCKSQMCTDGWQCASCGWSPDICDGFPLFAPELAESDVDYPKNAHDQLVQLEEGSFWFVSRNKLLIFFLDKYFPNAKNMLEIGCGTGFVLYGISSHRPEMRFYGAEAYTQGLKHAQRRVPKAEFAQMDAGNIPFSDEFDVIGAFDLLEHLSDDFVALKELYKAVKPGGGIIMTVPQHQWLWSRVDERSGHKRRYTRKMLRKAVETVGFRVVYMTSFVFLLLPFMLVSRMLSSSASKASTKVQAGLRLPDIINVLFTKVCALEQSLFIRRGISLPLGGSLLCVAKKM